MFRSWWSRLVVMATYSHCGCDEGDEGLTLFVSFSQKVMTALIIMLTFKLFVMEISVQFYVLDSSWNILHLCFSCRWCSYGLQVIHREPDSLAILLNRFIPPLMTWLAPIASKMFHIKYSLYKGCMTTAGETTTHTGFIFSTTPVPLVLEWVCSLCTWENLVVLVVIARCTKLQRNWMANELDWDFLWLLDARDLDFSHRETKRQITFGWKYAWI